MAFWFWLTRLLKRTLSGMPKLTVPMAALIQGFPPDWHFTGGKTAAYRQVGNAFPPPVAKSRSPIA